jgi:hypothetical protein
METLRASGTRTWRSRRDRGASKVPHVLLGCALASLLGVGAPAAACPDCAVGREARREVWSDGFVPNLILATTPLAIVVAVSAAANRIGRPKRKDGREETR